MAGRSEHPHKSVAERGVPEVSYVGSLIRIDVRVFDYDLAGETLGSREFSTQKRASKFTAVEPDIDVPVSRDFHCGYSGNRPDLFDQLCRYFPGSLTQLFRQLKGRGHGHLTKSL